jgi:hypothetical protein
MCSPNELDGLWLGSGRIDVRLRSDESKKSPMNTEVRRGPEKEGENG